MESQALAVGRSYGFREKRSDPGLIKVKLLDKVGRKGKVKIRFEDGPRPLEVSRLGADTARTPHCPVFSPGSYAPR